METAKKLKALKSTTPYLLSKYKFYSHLSKNQLLNKNKVLQFPDGILKKVITSTISREWGIRDGK